MAFKLVKRAQSGARGVEGCSFRIVATTPKQRLILTAEALEHLGQPERINLLIDAEAKLLRVVAGDNLKISRYSRTGQIALGSLSSYRIAGTDGWQPCVADRDDSGATFLQFKYETERTDDDIHVSTSD